MDRPRRARERSRRALPGRWVSICSTAALALKAILSGTALDDADALAATAAKLDVAFTDARVWLDGQDVTDAIRAEDVSGGASRVAVYAAVRAALLARQRAFRRDPGLVADGRDMGTVVFPDAPCKVFITASAEERARRRHKQLIEKGISSTIDSLLRELQERDARDAARTEAPMKAAEDAAVLDTTGLSIDDAIGFVLNRFRRRVAKGNEG
jgi:cytidylate kinase